MLLKRLVYTFVGDVDDLGVTVFAGIELFIVGVRVAPANVTGVDGFDAALRKPKFATFGADRPAIRSHLEPGRARWQARELLECSGPRWLLSRDRGLEYPR